MAARILIRWLTLLSVLVVSGGIASAAATNWQSVGMGDWFLGTNWDGGIPTGEIGRASCRERVEITDVGLTERR